MNDASEALVQTHVDQQIRFKKLIHEMTSNLIQMFRGNSATWQAKYNSQTIFLNAVQYPSKECTTYQCLQLPPYSFNAYWMVPNSSNQLAMPRFLVYHTVLFYPKIWLIFFFPACFFWHLNIHSWCDIALHQDRNALKQLRISGPYLTISI